MAITWGSVHMMLDGPKVIYFLNLLISLVKKLKMISEVNMIIL